MADRYSDSSSRCRVRFEFSTNGPLRPSRAQAGGCAPADALRPVSMPFANSWRPPRALRALRVTVMLVAARARAVLGTVLHPSPYPSPKEINVFTQIITVGAAATSSLTTAGQSGLRSLAIALGGGLGAVGAGVGIGLIFKGVLESVTRQPEMRSEITSIQWLGFALTEAVFFYGLVAGLIAYVL
jgi:F-type H+-transporting ATPase subunit c